MGAYFDGVIIIGLDIKTIKEKWDDMVAKDLHMDGHSYSGSIGMLGIGFDDQTSLIFDTLKEAVEYVSENQDKWSRAMAVRVKELTKKEKQLAYMTEPSGNIIVFIGGWCSS